ncbi:carbohydrate ABC transporter permease [Paenibacillus alba]|uniref:Carbohydrate ABC transporter permease n=1 Tax=Paenibacillus alba TaxID=1197127 RepID=A0ABU6G5B2_9BACL|nr:carbohydrate ABC transporter permease [Paenibacillus alba]MEC0229358.1 carbohydrate ABC transporter permease [Paenibacillus alba]
MSKRVLGVTIPEAAGLLLLLAVGLIYLFPFYWMIVTSLKTLSETLVFPPSFFPKQLKFENYVDVWRTGPFPRYVFNSFLVAISATALQLVVAIPAAYAFARKRFKGSKIIYGLILSGLMLPMQVVIIPIYLLLSKWGLINTYAALIIPYMVSPFAIFLLSESFKQLPEDIIDAAKMEQMSEGRLVWSMLLPMIKQIVVTVTLLLFITHWNDLFWVLIMTSSEKLHTLTVGMIKLTNTEGTHWQLLMAANVILVAPIFAIYVFASKHIKSAFTYSGIK